MNVNKLTNEARMVMAVLGLEHSDQLIAWDVDSIVEDVKLHRAAFLRERLVGSPQPPTSEQFQTSLADVWEASAASLEEILPHHEASMIDARRLRACARDLRWRESQVGSPQPPSEARKEEQ